MGGKSVPELFRISALLLSSCPAWRIRILAGTALEKRDVRLVEVEVLVAPGAPKWLQPVFRRGLKKQ